MNKLHDLLAKLQSIEEAANRSDIPAVQRKAQAEKQGYKDTWKVTKKELDAEEHEGKISHPKTLAKNSGRPVNEWDDGGDDTRGDAIEASIQDAMQKLGISLNDINSENVWDIGEKISDAIGSKYNDYYRTNSEHRDVPAEDVLDYLSGHIDLGDLSEEAGEPISDVAPENSEVAPQATDGGGAGASDESIEECGGDMGPKAGNVSMSMQDLLALMNHLQKGPVGHDQPLMGDEEEVGEEYGNDAPGGSESEVMPVAAVTATGNDMFSKGKEAPKVNGGGNPMAEALAALYADVKTRQLDELSKDTLASYAKKASTNKGYHNTQAGINYEKSNALSNNFSIGRVAKKGRDAEFTQANNDRFKHQNKAISRQQGIEKAVDKLSLKEANQMARQLRK